MKKVVSQQRNSKEKTIVYKQKGQRRRNGEIDTGALEPEKPGFPNKFLFGSTEPET